MLDDIRVATPCPASWANMPGDARRRFCDQCRLHVYNLSAMSRAQAEELIRSTEGRLCVRLYRRRDGTVITQDCPVGFAALKSERLFKLTAALILTVGAALWGVNVLKGPLLERFRRFAIVESVVKPLERTMTTMGERAPVGQLIPPPMRKPDGTPASQDD
jgi:hypothetical protein